MKNDMTIAQELCELSLDVNTQIAAIKLNRLIKTLGILNELENEWDYISEVLGNNTHLKDQRDAAVERLAKIFDLTYPQYADHTNLVPELKQYKVSANTDKIAVAPGVDEYYFVPCAVLEELLSRTTEDTEEVQEDSESIS